METTTLPRFSRVTRAVGCLQPKLGPHGTCTPSGLWEVLWVTGHGRRVQMRLPSPNPPRHFVAPGDSLWSHSPWEAELVCERLHLWPLGAGSGSRRGLRAKQAGCGLVAGAVSPAAPRHRRRICWPAASSVPQGGPRAPASVLSPPGTSGTGPQVGKLRAWAQFLASAPGLAGTQWAHSPLPGAVSPGPGTRFHTQS